MYQFPSTALALSRPPLRRMITSSNLLITQKFEGLTLDRVQAADSKKRIMISWLKKSIMIPLGQGKIMIPWPAGVEGRKGSPAVLIL